MSDAAEVLTEYRVVWWSEEYGRWCPHTLTHTDRPQIAAAWLQQAVYRGPYGERTKAFIESRSVTPWTRDHPSTPGASA